ERAPDHVRIRPLWIKGAPDIHQRGKAAFALHRSQHRLDEKCTRAERTDQLAESAAPQSSFAPIECRKTRGKHTCGLQLADGKLLCDELAQCREARRQSLACALRVQPRR